jgi:hypothetical protein
MGGMNIVKRVFRGLVFGLLAIVLLFEEWGWEPLANLFKRLARLPLWAKLERGIAALPRWGALLVFAVPMVGLFPVKLMALFLLGHGHAVAGLGLLIGAKLLGTAVLARLFQLTQPALMQFDVFARWYPRWKTWKDGFMAKIRQSEPWQMARRLKTRVKARFRAYLKAQVKWWSGMLRR